MPTTAILALALGYACYPNTTYGDKGAQDEIVACLKRFDIKRSGAAALCKNVELWLDRNEISTGNVFRRVWEHDPDSFVGQFIEFMASEEDSNT